MGLQFCGVKLVRRKEFEVSEEHEEDVITFLHEMSYGFLATKNDCEYPGILPINYVYFNDAIYFHGSRIGEKMNTIKQQPSVSFAVAKEYAQIPSYMNDPFYACPATVFFKSVIAQGNAVVVDDLEEKCDVLNALMQKLQPEGGYEPISLLDKGYAGQVKATAIVRIDIQQLNAKFKFGQNWKPAKLEHVSNQLLDRGHSLDEETTALMQRYCPHIQANDKA